MRQLVTVPLLLGSERESYRSAIFSFSSYCNPSPWCVVTHKQGRSQLTALMVCLLDGSKSSQVGSQFRSRARSSVQVMLQTLGRHGSRQGWVLCFYFLPLQILHIICFLLTPATTQSFLLTQLHITQFTLTHCSNLHPRLSHPGRLIWLTHDISPTHPTPDGSFQAVSTRCNHTMT